jgi:hypothetical protein
MEREFSMHISWKKQVLTIRSVADVEPLIGRAMYGVSLCPLSNREIHKSNVTSSRLSILSRV